MGHETPPKQTAPGTLKSGNKIGNPWHDALNGEFTSGPNAARSASSTPVAKSSAKLNLDQVIKLVADNNLSGLPNEMIVALIYKEDQALNPSQTVNGSSATGLMQVTKTALKELARVEDPSWLSVDRTDPTQNIRAGTLYVRVLIDRFGSVSVALNRYGDGPGYSKAIIAATTALKDNARLPLGMRKTPAEVLKKVFGR